MRGKGLAGLAFGLIVAGVLALALWRLTAMGGDTPPAATPANTAGPPGPPSPIPTLQDDPDPGETARERAETHPTGSPPLVATIWEDPPGDAGADVHPDSANRNAPVPEPSAELLPADEEGIDAAVFPQLRDIRECYQAWLEAQPDLAGRIVVRFVVSEQGGTGVVDRIAIVEGTSTGNTLFEGCVMNVMSELRFEAPPGGGTVEVDYPFVFRSE